MHNKHIHVLSTNGTRHSFLASKVVQLVYSSGEAHSSNVICLEGIENEINVDVNTIKYVDRELEMFCYQNEQISNCLIESLRSIVAHSR